MILEGLFWFSFISGDSDEGCLGFWRGFEGILWWDVVK